MLIGSVYENLIIGQKKAVNVYRFISKDSIEEDIIDRAKRKMVLEYSIISTMDTSGLSIMNKNGKKKSRSADNEKVSSEELQTILKFGAQNLFKHGADKDGTTPGEFSKLEEMNIDDILSRAEVHQGVEQTGTALGSAEFLTQFHVQDVAQMTWDELIPKDMRAEDEVDFTEVPEDLLLDSRRRGAPVSYKGADFSLDDGKRKRKTPKIARKRGEGNSLSDKESRTIVRGLLKYGDWKRRMDDILHDSDIPEKDPEFVGEFIKGLMNSCAEAMKAARHDTKTVSGKAKVTIANYGPITGINAANVIQRHDDMEFLNSRLEKQNLASFRITWSLKPVTNWSIPWGPKDDSMLLVGLFKHGHGAWREIQRDSSLPFKNKFFLDPLDKSLPSSVHLHRRSDFLLKSLREEEGKKPTHSSNSNSENSKSRKPVPTPSAPRRDDKRKSDVRKREPVLIQESDYESMDEAACKVTFAPVKVHLKKLHKPSKHVEKTENIPSFVRENLLVVGSFINSHLSGLKDQTRIPKTRKHLWKYASYFWPNEIPSRTYRSLFEKMGIPAERRVESASKIPSNNPRPKEKEIRTKKIEV